jgi:hypothetical protein
MDAVTLARMVWLRECEGREPSEVEGTVLLVDGYARAKRLTLGGFHPADVVDTLAPFNGSTAAAVAYGYGEFRWVVAVDREGTAASLHAVTGCDGPVLDRRPRGAVVAALAMAFIPAGALDRELAAILEGAS